MVRAWMFRSALAFAAVGLIAAAPARFYDTYENARYGYHLCYPADLFRPGPEPDAGDGIVLSGPHGAKLTVSGMPSVDDKPTPAKIVEEEKDQGVRVSYRAQGPGWAVLSGASAEGLFYGRAIETDGRTADWQLTYPKRDQALYAAVIPRLNQCFRMLKGSFWR